MAYTKSNMVYTDYKWNAGSSNDNPKITGKPDSTLLNRHEGYEMLYFINRCAYLWGWDENNILPMQRLERIIRERVPSDTRTHGGIREWISRNYPQI
jgi:hypothetical protein